MVIGAWLFPCWLCRLHAEHAYGSELLQINQAPETGLRVPMPRCAEVLLGEASCSCSLQVIDALLQYGS